MSTAQTPFVLITGAAGGIGTTLAVALSKSYRVVGFDLEDKLEAQTAACDCIAFDITSDASVELALRKYRDRYGDKIASVIHLAAYFDFTGEESPLYETVNVEGTRRLLRALQDFDVGQFVYSGTMLVHAPCVPGERINEDRPLAPGWAYPKSKAATEAVIKEEQGDIPIVLLHLAGLYDHESAVPTLSHQIARIFERDLKSHVYAGDSRAGQAMLHKEDLVTAVRRVVDRRQELPNELTILVGEPDVMSYEALQERLGRLIHGEEEWRTISVPKAMAKLGAWAEAKSEPIIPDAIDQGEKPFIRPFMIELADDHYALDIELARKHLDWTPTHSIEETLPRIVQALKRDPAGWYEKNSITPPEWLSEAAEQGKNPDALRQRYKTSYQAEHSRNLWAHFVNMGLGTWLLVAPSTLGYESAGLGISDLVSGAAVLALSLVSLSWRMTWARWACAGVGLWLLCAPLVFWAPTAASYLNDTLLGALVMGFAILTRPAPGLNPVAALTGPAAPPGWTMNPSAWLQRLPIIILAVIGLHISRYLAAYQLGHIDSVWEPFFAGAVSDPKNGTEEIITSSVSRAWPVSDAGVGAVTYMLEILTGVIGSTMRWRTMPWLVILFGIMIVPLGAVSITFIIIQPIVIGTWCTLCLIAAAAMLIQIPYSLDELVATGDFLWRRKQAGRSLLRVFFLGDTDEDAGPTEKDDFQRSAPAIARDMMVGGVNLPWNLALCSLIGLWLMFTRLTLGAEDGMANADHLIGSLVVTTAIIALAEVARPLRFVNMGFGLALLITPIVYDASLPSLASGLICGLALIALSARRGPVTNRYGRWSRYIV